MEKTKDTALHFVYKATKWFKDWWYNEGTKEVEA